MNDQQTEALRAIEGHAVTFLLGVSGTGKSHLAMVAAVQAVLDGKARSIVLVRPAVEAGEKLGHIPGGISDKVSPYLRPLIIILDKLCGKTGKRRELLNKSIAIESIAYMRGATFDESYVILDEAQNCTGGQIKLVISRLGRFSRMIITGDPGQSDLHPADRAIMAAVGRLERLPIVAVRKLTKVVRHPALAEILECLRDFG